MSKVHADGVLILLIEKILPRIPINKRVVNEKVRLTISDLNLSDKESSECQNFINQLSLPFIENA